MRALLVDDHVLFVQGLQFLLEDLKPELLCVTATSVTAAVAQPGPFDFVLLDYRLPDCEGPEGLKRVLAAHPESTVIMLSAEDEADPIRELVDLGAAGFVPKSADTAMLLKALGTVLAGGTYLPPVALQGARPAEGATAHAVASLSPRQLDCILKLVQGKPNKTIARELGLADSSVKTHLSAAFRALGVTNRTEAVFKAASLGLLPSKRPV